MVEIIMDMKRFGKKLREKRKDHGMTYQELADLCHINHGYVRQLEAGSKLPSMQLLFSLCDILGTSPNYLLEYAEDSDDKELLKRIYQLMPDQKNAMICMLDAYIRFQKKTIGFSPIREMLGDLENRRIFLPYLCGPTDGYLYHEICRSRELNNDKKIRFYYIL